MKWFLKMNTAEKKVDDIVKKKTVNTPFIC